MNFETQKIIDERVAEINRSTDPAYIVDVKRQTRQDYQRQRLTNSQYSAVVEAVDERLKVLAGKEESHSHGSDTDIAWLKRCFDAKFPETENNPES